MRTARNNTKSRKSSKFQPQNESYKNAQKQITNTWAQTWKVYIPRITYTADRNPDD